jgi:calcineurin-like phosphoesterase family protein
MVVFLGDFIFKSGNELRGEGAKHDWKYYRDQLNGEIVFCRGNHCLNNGLNTHIISLIVELANKEIYCCHNPIDITNGLGLKYNLCGHVHEKWKTKKYVINKIPTYIINVGVDSNNFYPVSASEIIETFAKMEK